MTDDQPTLPGLGPDRPGDTPMLAAMRATLRALDPPPVEDAAGADAMRRLDEFMATLNAAADGNVVQLPGRAG